MFLFWKKNAEFYADSNFFFNGLTIMFFRKKFTAKNIVNSATSGEAENLLSYLPRHFFLSFWAHFNECGISIKFCVYWFPVLILMTKIFLGHISIFANFKCICSRNIFRHFTKSKNLLFCHLRDQRKTNRKRKFKIDRKTSFVYQLIKVEWEGSENICLCVKVGITALQRY